MFMSRTAASKLDAPHSFELTTSPSPSFPFLVQLPKQISLLFRLRHHLSPTPPTLHRSHRLPFHPSLPPTQKSRNETKRLTLQCSVPTLSDSNLQGLGSAEKHVVPVRSVHVQSIRSVSEVNGLLEEGSRLSGEHGLVDDGGSVKNDEIARDGGVGFGSDCRKGKKSGIGDGELGSWEGRGGEEEQEGRKERVELN